MKEIALVAEKRETGKKATKAVRNSGYVPGNYYANGDENISIKAKPLSLRPVVYTSLTRLVNLKIESDNIDKLCFLKDVKFDPVSDQIVHFDLQGIKQDQKISVEVPFKLTGGQPIGVRQGGKLMQVLHKIKIKCLPKDMVESIEAPVGKLEMGSVLYLKDLNTENLEIELPEDAVIARVSKPRGGAAATATS
ncbi:MAG: 50S ribosomal protein L25 [Candidatus Kapabacteria bacterium]|nr:50S ribosomal protein L25 [Ignavibacteriota bacterium]MCW5886015.1 50S ribosomal protein L25 [Candidatus Kapabacteria bacterium]